MPHDLANNRLHLILPEYTLLQRHGVLPICPKEFILALL